MSLEVISMFIGVLVFPGMLFLVALALFTQYLVRKLSARLQKRMGPSYVGPAGVMQPFYDFWKLLRAKEVVRTRFSMTKVAEFALLVGISSAVASVIFLPLNPWGIKSEFDILMFFYMASVVPLIALVIASLAMPSPYTALGVSRLLSLATICEPAFFASIVIPAYLATRSPHSKALFLSISEASPSVVNLWLNPLTALTLALCFISYIFSIQAKAMFPPYNIPEAEQEIIAGFETEFSGPLLALARLLHDLDLTVSILAGIYILLGGPYPFRHFSVQGAILLVVKYLAVLFVVTFIKNIMGRYRIEQALVQLFKYGLILAIVAAVLAAII